MEIAMQSSTEVDVLRYKTPLGKLARRFKVSLESWKQKYRDLKCDLKRFQNRANDALRSRDHWKTQAKLWQDRAEQRQAELDRLQSDNRLQTDIAGPRTKLPVVS